ncbi:MAG TPA: histidine phosphatase family protein [Acidisarcina sp.]|nr:histidine phosphatase family protein [Acidisarcina sp.]
MKAFILMRHGATDMAGRFCGHSDPPLNDGGRAQIERAASLLHVPPEVVYTSDLLRARQSAAIIAAHFAVPVKVRPDLREICFGQWEGLSWQEIERCFPAESRAWVERFPAGVIQSGESYKNFLDRVKREMAFLIDQAESQALLAVTHGGVIRTALSEVHGLSAEEAHRASAEYGSAVDLSRLHLGVG